MPKNEVAVIQPSEFAIISKHDEIDIGELIEENLDGETLSPMDMGRITVPAGGVTVWQIETSSGTETQEFLDGIIVATAKTRSYWQKEMSGEGEPPDCYSENGVIGIGDPGGLCETCKFNEWGSSPKEGSKAKACKEMRNVFFLTNTSMLPFNLSVPPTSLRSFKNYARRLVQDARSINGVITRFGLVKDKSSTGFTHGVVTFDALTDLNAQEKQVIKAYKQSFKKVLSQAEPTPAPAQASEG